MLQEIAIENFRAFNDEVKIRIRPITILIGRNSAGKSSILKFLLMLRQTLESGDEQFLVTEGRHVHLGALRDLKHSAGKRRKLKFHLAMSGQLTPDIWRDFKLELDKIKLQSNRKPGKGNVLFSFPRTLPTKGEIRQALFNIDAEFFYGNPKLGTHTVSAMVGKEIDFERTTPNLARTRFLRFPPDTTLDAAKLILTLRDEQYLTGIREEIKSVRHLAAIREESQRAIIVASPPPGDVGHMGEFAIPHLQHICDEKGSEFEFIMKHLQSVANVDKVEFKDKIKGYLRQCTARNKDTSAVSYLADLGFGVSQCLPIFIQGAMMYQRQLLTAEQPEAQLHPTAQLEMGTFFAELWKERQVPSIIETHSGNILLRLRKHISRGQLLPEDVSVAYFHVLDGCVVVDNLEISSDGKLSPGLPMEFFGADILDSLDMA
jgi:predicted ATPase